MGGVDSPAAARELETRVIRVRDDLGVGRGGCRWGSWARRASRRRGTRLFISSE
jgi:hypothetical protein